jgi:hypothetical protein
MVGCETEVQQPSVHVLTQADAAAVVTVTAEVAKLIAVKQASGATSLDIHVDEDFACTGGGSGHMTGDGSYEPRSGTETGPTTFDITVTLDSCSSGFGVVSTTMAGLTGRGAVETGVATTNLTFRGEVAWAASADTCQITLKLYGADFSTFDGVVCATHITPELVPHLPL